MREEGSRVVSAADPYGHKLGFLDQKATLKVALI
jgi:hypothetical protein